MIEVEKIEYALKCAKEYERERMIDKCHVIDDPKLIELKLGLVYAILEEHKAELIKYFPPPEGE